MNFTDEELREIGQRVVENYNHDESERSDWLHGCRRSIEIARMLPKEKSFPYTGASNVKLPLVTDAAIRFASRAYAEIINFDGVVKCKTFGNSSEKEARANRVSSYMNWQLLQQEKNWQNDTDQLLHMLPIIGHVFRKRFFNPAKNQNDSMIVMPDQICCNKDGSRKTQIIEMTYSEIVSKQRSGEWSEDVDLLKDHKKKEEKILAARDAKFTILEQHCFMDLDKDYYQEPYIIVVEKDSGEVLSITKRYDEFKVQRDSKDEIYHIEPDEYFVDYRFLPDPAGCYYGIGFGQLLGPLTEAANNLLNQLVDSGTLHNVQGGFLSDKVEILGGRHQFGLGEWKKLKLTGNTILGDNILPLPTKEPSPTLFNLLGLLIEMNRDLASIKDVLTGDNIGSNVAATTTVALIEQGMKTFNTIYKRIYKSLSDEFKILYRLNHEYMNMEEYFEFQDSEEVALQEDFNPKGLDVIPTADPDMASDMQRLVRAEALKNTIGAPGVNPMPIMRQYYRALRVDEKLMEEILAPQPPAGPSPEAMALLQSTEIAQSQLQIQEEKNRMDSDIKNRKLALDEKNAEVERIKTVSTAIKEIALAEAAEAGTQIESYRAQATRPVIGD